MKAPTNGDNGSVSGGRFYPIRAIQDKAPRVFFLKPGKDVSAAPGSKVDVSVKATDDYGIQQIVLMAADGEKAPPRPLDTLKPEAPRKEATLSHILPIDGKKYKEGDVIVLQAFTMDNRDLMDIDVGGPQRTESNQVRIRVEDPERLARERAERLAKLRRRLEVILKLQVQTKAETIRAKHETAMASFGKRLPKILGGQGKVHSEVLDVGEHFEFEADLIDMKRALLLLAHNEAADALTLAKSLRQVTSPASIKPQADGLINVQQKIIDVLETLLGVVVAAEKGKIEGDLSRFGGDMPPDQLEKLRKLMEELQRFIDEQKRVVHATAHLAKRPVDDYSARELERLKELEAVEDQWDKFLAEAVSDFSKMAEQDFSNPALLQELIEIQDDVVMAKDALKKKAVEIAVPIENAGAELAEGLTTHLERWLPDTPDRTKWSMEEPLTETDIPMAELPKELQDLVGELMEQEEDLYDEMEDVTSAWGDSLDKGAGWDAMDGPISNMSAQGVTGNRLPNSSEISGRSGEGRTGRTVGEMVEKRATGKGGRRTPTRLSPDPFQRGEVEDTSKDPGGGATGGGKVSGLSGEGLEGPVPQEMQKELGRLARKQASLRNKGEKINARFKVSKFDNFKLLEALRLMGRAADDLNAYRYQNALRRRTVIIDSLNTTRLLLGGQIKTHTDESASMPKRDRDLIADAAKAEMPKGYRQDVKRYLTTLSELAEQ